MNYLKIYKIQLIRTKNILYNFARKIKVKFLNN